MGDGDGAAEYDAVVVGLGVAGRAACRELARRGRRVLGLDRHGSAHRLGSSHGQSRLLRALYHESPYYVPLLRRARDAWRELERESGETLLLDTGGLVIGPPDGRLVVGSLATASERDVPCEELSAGEVERRFPAFEVPAGHRVLLDPGAGLLRADRCMSALRDGARGAGAELRFRDAARRWSRRDDGFLVETASGPVGARSLVVAAGGWTADLVGRDLLPLVVERQTVHRFPSGGGPAYRPGRFPVFLLERTDGTVAYGAPDLGSGVKLAVHHGGETGARPEDVRRPAEAVEGRRARAAVDVLLPGLGDRPADSEACLYVNTPDRDFVIDRLAEGSVVATGFSGHGFKFAPAVAEAVGDLLAGGDASLDLSPFGLGRWDG